MPEVFCSIVNSPVGAITIMGTADFIHTVSFTEKDTSGTPENEITAAAAQELAEYFNGKLQSFSFPMLQTGTAFQEEVWQSLLKIPYGTTLSYAKFSSHNPLAIRAIAAANGKNNIAIAVPCHRVIGSSGKLVGYAGGLWRKQWLLQHERDVAQSGQAVLKF